MARDEIISILNKYKISTEDKIAVAVSGGADSIFLLNFLFENNYNNIFVLHLNHNLREDSIKDQLIVEKFCQNNKIKYKIFNWDGKWKNNLEAEARNIRYELFLNHCNEYKINYFLTAHHANDQIETFLMNLERGSGIDGLTGIKEYSKRFNVQIIRPMLGIYKEELIDYLKNKNISWAEDYTNKSNNFKRNKIRNIINAMDEKNKNLINKRILKTTKLLYSAKKVLDKGIEKIFQEEIKIDNNKISFNIDNFLKLEYYEQISLLSKIFHFFDPEMSKLRLKQIEMIIKEIINRHLKCQKIRKISINIKNNLLFFTKEIK